MNIKSYFLSKFGSIQLNLFFCNWCTEIHLKTAVANLGGEFLGCGGTPFPYWVKKEEITGGRKGQAKQNHPPPPFLKLKV